MLWWILKFQVEYARLPKHIWLWKPQKNILTSVVQIKADETYQWSWGQAKEPLLCGESTLPQSNVTFSVTRDEHVVRIHKDRMFESFNLRLGIINWRVTNNEKISTKHFKRHPLLSHPEVRMTPDHNGIIPWVYRASKVSGLGFTGGLSVSVSVLVSAVSLDLPSSLCWLVLMGIILWIFTLQVTCKHLEVSFFPLYFLSHFYILIWELQTLKCKRRPQKHRIMGF